jgi:hypothetical protein
MTCRCHHSHYGAHGFMMQGCTGFKGLAHVPGRNRTSFSQLERAGAPDTTPIVDPP